MSNFDMNLFDKMILPVWEGNTVYDETLFFLGKDEKKQLLYEPEEIISVRSFDHTKEFVRGKDYDLENGRLVLLEGTEMPYMTEKDYYYGADITDFLQTNVNGEWKNTYWGGGEKTKKYQVAVTYTHKDKWNGFDVPNRSESFAGFLSKLERGENVTVFYYGDSITVGANASSLDNHGPFMPTWSELVTMKLAKQYGYTVHFVATDFVGGSKLPREDISFGDRGVITMINTAVGGWTVVKGIENFEVHCELFLRKYGCDLLVLAFGMNDKKNTPEEENALVSKLVDMFLEYSEPEILLVSTMLPNPDANERWNLNQKYFEAEFNQIADRLSKSGHPSAVAPMTSVSRSVLERKIFRDWTGNNVNHPNDFMIRIYAATLIKTLIG